MIARVNRYDDKFIFFDIINRKKQLYATLTITKEGAGTLTRKGGTRKFRSMKELIEEHNWLVKYACFTRAEERFEREFCQVLKSARKVALFIWNQNK